MKILKGFCAKLYIKGGVQREMRWVGKMTVVWFLGQWRPKGIRNVNEGILPPQNA
jgi:hypothetical protein